MARWDGCNFSRVLDESKEFVHMIVGYTKQAVPCLSVDDCRRRFFFTGEEDIFSQPKT